MSLRALDAVLSVIVPPCCGSCRQPVGEGVVLCPDCEAGLVRLHGGCPRCALPGHGSGAGPAGCPAAAAAFDAAWAPFAYDGPARALMHALKLDGRLSLAGWMAREMAAGVPAGGRLVPVPAAPARRRRRGFDPAALLCGALGQAEDVLRRRDSSARQVGAGRRARRAAAGRLRVQAVAAAPERVILIDDVHTTGATLDACARALKAAGARHVTALTFARSL